MAKPKVVLDLETQWLRGYARTYLPSEGALEFPPAVLRQAGVTLVAIRNVFRSGRVVYSDKLDEAGARWIVEGDDGNGVMLSLSLVVVSEVLSVRLETVTKLVLEEVKVQESGHDAA